MPIDYSNIDLLFAQTNLAENIEEKELSEIGEKVCRDFENDLRSRDLWQTQHDQWMKLATQVIESRTFPWQDAANVKYPLLTTSAMQFQARAYPTLVNGVSIVKARVIGEDKDEAKLRRAERIGKHMSYQVLEEMENWDEEMDKACFILPITGCLFKKVYYDADKGHNVSELVLPKDLVVNYWAKSLETAYTKTHVLYMLKNTVKEKQLGGVFLDYDLKTASSKEMDSFKTTQENSGLKDPGTTEDAPLTILEQYRWLDLDNDGYEEPYIVTVEYSEKKVLRIVPRFEKEGVKTADGKIIKIIPDEYFIKFSFLPNPDGGFYDLGFGALLGPLNETVNTLLNQLLDAGTINNLQGGWISKGIRIKAGENSFSPGEWKTVQTSGDDLRKGIFPLPTKEPSSTLFQLLGTIVESGNQLASVAEIFVGKMPGQNTPATTTMATIEQGMKVFTAIYKRIYRSLTKEFKRLYKLNRIYLERDNEFRVLDSQELQQIGQSDYMGDDTDVMPTADPNSVSEMLRLTKAQALMELIPLGTVNPAEATRRILEAQDQPDIEKLLNQGPPPPDPKMIEAQVKVQTAEALAKLKEQELQLKMQMEQEKGKFDIEMKQMELQLKAMEAQLKLETAHKQALLDTQKAHMDMKVTQLQGEQKMEMANMQHEQKKRELAQSAKEKEKSSSGEGSKEKASPVTVNIDNKGKVKKRAKKAADGSWEIVEEPVKE